MNKICGILYKKIKGKVNYARKLGVKIGKNCIIIGDVTWGSEPYLIQIGDNCRITNGVRFFTHDGGVWVIRNLYNEENIDVFGKITIGNNVNISWDVTILPGVTIGNNVIIGAGAIVTHDVPDNSVVAGVPARIIETIDEYYQKIKVKCDYTKEMNIKEKKIYLKNKYKL